jgi:hypothetical protein
VTEPAGRRSDDLSGRRLRIGVRLVGLLYIRHSLQQCEAGRELPGKLVSYAPLWPGDRSSSMWGWWCQHHVVG